MITVTSITRHERRTLRRRMFLTVKEAKLASRMARLDYKVSGETGAMKVPTKSIIGQHGRKNAYAPPPGRAWSRSGPTYVIETDWPGTLAKPIIHHRWRGRDKIK